MPAPKLQIPPIGPMTKVYPRHPPIKDRDISSAGAPVPPLIPIARPIKPKRLRRSRRIRYGTGMSKPRFMGRSSGNSYRRAKRTVRG